MTESDKIQLTYMPVRGRCEPVFLLLVDFGVEFTNVTIGPDEWMEMKRSELGVGPPQFPYTALPVLRVSKPEGDGNTSDLVLGETTAILTFFDEYLQRGVREKLSLETRVRIQMVRDASLFFLNRVFQMSVDKDWLGPISRKSIFDYIVKPYLRGTESSLVILAVTESSKRQVIPSALDPLGGTAASVFTTILFILDLFPSMEKNLQEGGEFVLCGKLWKAVGERARIKAWYNKENIMGKAWTISEYGTAEWIKSEGKKYDNYVM